MEEGNFSVVSVFSVAKILLCSFFLRGPSWMRQFFCFSFLKNGFPLPVQAGDKLRGNDKKGGSEALA